MSLRSRESVSLNSGKKASLLVHLPPFLHCQFSWSGSAVRDAFSYVEVHFHSPTLSSALSNMGTIGSTSQEMWRKLYENAAIEKRSRSSTRTVHGKRRSLWLHCQEMTPNHLATGYKLEHTNLGMLWFMDTPPLGAYVVTDTFCIVGIKLNLGVSTLLLTITL